MTSTRSGAIVAAAFLAAGILRAQAQSAAGFYRGKTINVLIGVGVGGGYDLQARTVAGMSASISSAVPQSCRRTWSVPAGSRWRTTCSRRPPGTEPISG
jgi:hypothetical protein